MAFEKVLAATALPRGSKQVVKTGTAGETEILLVHTEEGTLHAVEPKCPHAGAPLVEGAVCNGRLICPWHMGTFALAGEALPEGTVLEPPPLRSLKHYAVKSESGLILVDPSPLNAPSLARFDDNAPAATAGADQHVVAIGGGAAATAAICTLRQAGFAGRITLIDPVASEPADRTNLSKMTLAGKKPVDTLPLWSPDERDKLKIERVTASVIALDGEAGRLHTSDQQTIFFDAALLATGGQPKTLGIPGDTLPQVHTIRHVPDVEAINVLIGAPLGDDPKGKRVVLIGDSFIAFEAASALKTRGLDATLVCRSPQPFSKKFGETPAQALVGLHQANGVTLKLGAEAREILEAGTEAGEAAGTALQVMLKSGETLAADLVIVAIGVRPATDFSHGLLLEEDGGITVDASLQVQKKLWVAGDIAAVNGVRIEHWRVAQQHGRVAADSILDAMGHSRSGMTAATTAALVPFFWTAHFGKRFGYAGHAEHWDDLQVDGSLPDLKFLAYFLKGGTVAAVLGCGRDAALAMLAETMRAPLTLEQARKAVAKA